MDTLLLSPELFAADGGIARLMRLYLKALSDPEMGNVRAVALNDAVPERSALAPYAGPGLASLVSCDRSRLRFILAAILGGLRSRRIICGHVAQLPVAWAVSLVRPGLSYHLVAHGIEVWRPFTLLERISLRGARSVWCVSAYTRDRLLENCPLPDGRAQVLPNALDPALDPGAPKPAPKGPPVILTVSRLSLADNYKGIDHLIMAMPTVVRAIPGARLRIVGRGDAEASLRALAAGAGAADAVDFLGFVSDEVLRSEFAACRLFALPSQREGFGLVYLEAMAHGRPCLAARAGGAPEVVDSDCGVLVEYGNVGEIAARAAEALGRTWDAAAVRASGGRFSFEHFKERLLRLLAP